MTPAPFPPNDTSETWEDTNETWEDANETWDDRGDPNETVNNTNEAVNGPNGIVNHVGGNPQHLPNIDFAKSCHDQYRACYGYGPVPTLMNFNDYLDALPARFWLTPNPESDSDLRQYLMEYIKDIDRKSLRKF
jgi:hypothetical protein